MDASHLIPARQEFFVSPLSERDLEIDLSTSCKNPFWQYLCQNQLKTQASWSGSPRGMRAGERALAADGSAYFGSGVL